MAERSHNHDGPGPDEREGRRVDPVVSMHRDVPTWCDTCCCEPEPRWQAVAEDLGLDDDG